MRERVFSMMAYLCKSSFFCWKLDKINSVSPSLPIMCVTSIRYVVAREKPDSVPKSADLNLNGNSVHAFIRINEGDETANWMSRVDEPKATQSLNKTFLGS